MSVDTHVSCGASQAFVLFVQYVLVSSRIDKLFGKTKVYYMYRVVFFAWRPADKEILRLHIPIDKILWMYIFNAADLQSHPHSLTTGLITTTIIIRIIIIVIEVVMIVITIYHTMCKVLLQRWVNNWSKNFDKRPHRRLVTPRNSEWICPTLILCDTWFLGLTRVRRSNGILMGLAASAGFTRVPKSPTCHPSRREWIHTTLTPSNTYFLEPTWVSPQTASRSVKLENELRQSTSQCRLGRLCHHILEPRCELHLWPPTSNQVISRDH